VVEGRMAVVVGETRGGGTTRLDFFVGASASAMVSVRPTAAAPTTAAGTIVAGRAGTGVTEGGALG
jgi:hypothetical protein